MVKAGRTWPNMPEPGKVATRRKRKVEPMKDADRGVDAVGRPQRQRDIVVAGDQHRHDHREDEAEDELVAKPGKEALRGDRVDALARMLDGRRLGAALARPFGPGFRLGSRSLLRRAGQWLVHSFLLRDGGRHACFSHGSP